MTIPDALAHDQAIALRALSRLLDSLPAWTPRLYCSIGSGVEIQVPTHLGDETERADIYRLVRSRLDGPKPYPSVLGWPSVQGTYNDVHIHLYAPANAPADDDDAAVAEAS